MMPERRCFYALRHFREVGGLQSRFSRFRGRQESQGRANGVIVDRHQAWDESDCTRRESRSLSPKMFCKGRELELLLRETVGLGVRSQCKDEDDGLHWVRSHCARQIREERFRLVRIATDMGRTTFTRLL